MIDSVFIDPTFYYTFINKENIHTHLETRGNARSEISHQICSVKTIIKDKYICYSLFGSINPFLFDIGCWSPNSEHIHASDKYILSFISVCSFAEQERVKNGNFFKWRKS